MVLGVGAFSLSIHTLSPLTMSLYVIGNPRCGRLDWYMSGWNGTVHGIQKNC